jgi:outer membrane immunogenic protein
MNKLLLTAAAALTLALPAQAADMPVKAPRAVAVAAPVFNWTGFYVGATVGYGWGRPRHEDEGGAVSSAIDMTGVAAGATVGVNYQVNRIVLGAEADWSWAKLDGSVPDSGGFGCDGECRTKIRSFATARGRLGVLVTDRVLVYGTAGAAWSRIRATLGGVGDTDTKSGWTAGGGLEFAATEWLSFKAEYLHVHVPNFLYDPVGDICGGNRCFSARNSFDVFRVGANYRFGFGGPVVARY